MKRLFLILLLASLAISAVIGIVIFILGDFGEDDGLNHTQFKLLFTTFAVAGFSVTGLVSSLLYDLNRALFLSYTGIAVSMLGFLVFMTGYGVILAMKVSGNQQPQWQSEPFQ